MRHSPCQSLFHEVRCTPRCQGVIPHVCRCGCKASWITNPPSHIAQPHGPPTSPAPTPHCLTFSRKTDVLMRPCLLDCTMLWIQKASHRQLLKLSNNLLMTVVYNIPHKWCVILSCALASGLPIPRGNSHTATAGVPCSHLPFWCILLGDWILNSPPPKDDKVETAPGSSWSISQGQSSKLWGGWWC